MDPTTAAVVAIVIAAGSEIIGLLPIKENTWVQLIIKALKILFPKRGKAIPAGLYGLVIRIGGITYNAGHRTINSMQH